MVQGLANAIVTIILQYINVSDQHLVHLKLTQCCQFLSKAGSKTTVLNRCKCYTTKLQIGALNYIYAMVTRCYYVNVNKTKLKCGKIKAICG